MLSHLNKNKRMRWMIITIVSIAFFYFLLPIRTNLFKEEYSTVVKAENAALLHVFINQNEQWFLPPDTIAIPEKLKTAVILFEDESFYHHLGVNVRAIIRAAGQNISKGEIISGASTIPMQIARMARPKKRTYLNKVTEMFFAIKLSLHYSKGELLKLYLDHAPYGGNVIGYRTASFKYYNKEARYLTWSEAATLAVLPNAPGLIYPSKTSSLLENKRNVLLKKLYQEGYISEQSYQLAMLESVPDRFIPFESKAPHIARRLKRDNPKRDIITTSIDDNLQVQCNRIAQRYQRIYSTFGINNLAILVADTKSGAVKAYVGSPDFFDFENGGQVDGVRASRSSGSILKPFLYALSIDEGLIGPDSYIRDLPTYFEGFSPRNANREYQGVVSAREALVRSLNIPAVRLLNSYGVYQFYSFLKLSGVSTLFRSADAYGLPLILGGAEVSMWDMVSLYRGMANGGVFSENYLQLGEKTMQSEQLISEGSCYLTLDILKDLKRPGGEFYWEKYNGSSPIAWKTGTSYGHKDAWAVGVNPEYTIAVWCGNFNGDGNNNLSGVASAGPILFDVLQLQQTKNKKEWFEKSDMDYKMLKVCSLSGFRASEACSETVEIEVPYGMRPLKQCEYHQHRFFSENEKNQCCSRCWDEIGSVKKTVCIYPPDIAYYLREKGQYIDKIAPHYPECPAYTSENSLKIIYPNMEAKLFLPRDYNGKTQSVVCRVGHRSIKKQVFWYLNELYLGMTSEDHSMEILFNEGWNNLKVIDENGAQDSRKVFVTTRKSG